MLNYAPSQKVFLCKKTYHYLYNNISNYFIKELIFNTNFFRIYGVLFGSYRSEMVEFENRQRSASSFHICELKISKLLFWNSNKNLCYLATIKIWTLIFFGFLVFSIILKVQTLFLAKNAHGQQWSQKTGQSLFALLFFLKF